jgi:hypothetical protein
MRSAYIWRLVRVTALVLIMLLLGLIPVSIPTVDDLRVPTGTSARPLAPILQGVSVVQQFPAGGDAISAISLQLATYQRVNHGTANLVVRAYTNGQWTNIATQAVNEEQLQDNVSHVFTFSPPLAVKRAQPLSITLTADGDASQAITWWTNPNWQAPGFQLLVDGVPQTGTGHFTVAYTYASGPLGRMLPLVWQRVTIFLDPIWQAVLLFGVSLVLLAGVLYLWWV